MKFKSEWEIFQGALNDWKTFKESVDFKNPMDILFSVTAILISIVLTLIVYFASTIYGVLALGFVGMKLWSWFIVPVFGVPLLTITQAWGISTILSFWNHNPKIQTNKDERENSEIVFHNILLILQPWIVLAMAWFVKTFVFVLFI